jgi:hypothetical protein
MTRDADLRRKYGITAADYDRMLAKQGGVCAICRGSESGGRGTFHVDHCHATGRIRGLLCHWCNVALGCFRDRPERLERAIEYLNEGGKT